MVAAGVVPAGTTAAPFHSTNPNRFGTAACAGVPATSSVPSMATIPTRVESTRVGLGMFDTFP
ncbi:hypothetical protein ACFQZ4_12000 [Catellatospora coxensis]